MKRHGEAASSNAETIREERKRVQDLIREAGYEPRDVFNMDETGLFYGYARAYFSLNSKFLTL
jgi:hypothetical protein